jgi:predicted glycosyltransferase
MQVAPKTHTLAMPRLRAVRVWIDITAPAHVLVFRPLVQIMRGRGDEVEITAREFGQTVELLRFHGLEAALLGRHGRSAPGKLATMATRLAELLRWARGRRFDVALAHGSHHLTLAARALRIPSATTFDYEWATIQHQLGCRAATRVLVPEAIPPERLRRYGVGPPKLRRYPGLKEEYYLSDFEPDPRAAGSLGLDSERVLVVVRTPPDAALYHRHGNPLFPALLERLGRNEDVHAVVVPRGDEQRAWVRSLGLPSLVVPDGAVDAQSLIASADLVVSAGGTVNREAVALGVPVYTAFQGRLGAVDEALLRGGRLRLLTDPGELELVKREDGAGRVRRDPRSFLELLLPL